VLERITELYAIEAEIRSKAVDERRAVKAAQEEAPHRRDGAWLGWQAIRHLHNAVGR
jgi:hypothetical protein